MRSRGVFFIFLSLWVSWQTFVPTHKIFAKSSCQSHLGSCEYYACLNESFFCPTYNYLSDFGYLYCHHFDAKIKQQLGEEAQVWLESVKLCLQLEIENHKNFDWSKPNTHQCQKLQQFSIGSHSDCYVQTGYCGLPDQDREKIRRVILPSLWRMDLFQEGLEIFAACGHAS